MEDKLTSDHIDHFQTVNQFKFRVSFEALEKFDLVQVLKANIASAYRIKRDDLLENVTGQDPAFTVGNGGDGSGSLVVIQECNFPEPNHFIVSATAGVQNFFECDFFDEVGVTWVRARLVYSDARLTL